VHCQFFNKHETEIIDAEILKLLDQKVIVEADFEEGQYISPIFLRQKKNGEYRLILNLKKLNESMPYHHFKMETFESALSIVTKNMYFCSIDIRNAYYSVPIADEHQKYLRFVWRGKLFQFTCLPNGLCCGPRKFTKLMKPVYANLRKEGHICTGFIDDSLLGASTYKECVKSVNDTTNLLLKLGFMLNEEKSVLIPTHKIVYLGNIIDSESMVVYLPDDKKENIRNECRKLINKEVASIRHVAKVIGLIVSTFSAVEFGKLFYRDLEQEKTIALRKNFGKFDADMRITPKMKAELDWWYCNVASQVRHISKGDPTVTIQTDSSTYGWGMVHEGRQIGGRWSESERKFHINVLEIKAILFAIKSLSGQIAGKHIKILSDSSTAVCYISNMGGVRSPECNRVARDIWLWCLETNSWISIAHIPGKSNEADAPSRQFNDKIEWELDDQVFNKLSRLWGKPSIDLFASRLNNKVAKYCAWKPDPFAYCIDAFTENWQGYNLAYLFPPFSLISRCVRKIQDNQAQAVLVVPLWETQIWFSPLMKLLRETPVVLPKTKHILSLPHTNEVHPLADKLVMIACRVSGVPSEAEGFLQGLPISSWLHGESQPRKDIKLIYADGYSIVVRDRLIKFRLL